MSKSTRATLALSKSGVPFTVHEYAYDPHAEKIGLQAAAELGEDPARVLKTLMAEVDGRPVCVIVPSNHEVSMKKLASAFKGRSASMMKPATAEKQTGYVVGGISPFGQKKAVPTAIEITALDHDLVFISGGRRGLQVRLDPKDARMVLAAIDAPLVA